MIDSGATIIVMHDNFFGRICNNLPIKFDKSTHKKCLLASGTHVLLDKRVDLPIRFNSITIEAELYVLSMNHVSIIIGCDLMDLFNASIDIRTSSSFVSSNRILPFDYTFSGIFVELMKVIRSAWMWK